MLGSFFKLLYISNTSTILIETATRPAALQYSQTNKAEFSFAVKTLHMLAPRYVLDRLATFGTQSYAWDHQLHL